MGIFTKNKFIFNKTEEKTIVDKIKLAEDQTSGEIRVHVEPTCKEDSFQRALELFKELGMHRTKLQNGVLFYIAYESHKFAIVADEGINKVVPLDFWESMKDKMSNEFKKGKFVEGLSDALTLTGQQLKLHFPHNGKDDENELSDNLSK